MREIKFRAWDKIFKEFHLAVGSLALKLQEEHPERYIALQYTGLKDKNGKECFESDICIGNWPYAKKCVIIWNEKRAGFYLKPVEGDGILGGAAYDNAGYKLGANKFEVIGNIYENPELVK